MKKYILTIILAILINITFSCGCFENGNNEGNGWGKEGDLELKISLNPDTIEQIQSTKVNLTLTNTGSTKLRALYPWWLVPPNLIIVKDENGKTLRCLRDYEPPPKPKNEDLTNLEPGEKISKIFDISSDLYDLENGKIYTLQGKYIVGEYETLTLPYWKGEIYSGYVYLTIK